MVVLPKTTTNIDYMLSVIHIKDKPDNRNMLLKVIQNLCFLGIKAGRCSQSNFMQLLKLHGNDDPTVYD